MERSKVVLIGLLVACLPLAVATGLGGPGGVALAAVGVVTYSALSRLRARAAPDRAWAAPVASFRFTGAAPRRVGRGGVPAALGRVESRRLLDSVALWAGVWLGVLAVWLLGWVWSDDTGGDIGRVAELVPWVVHPLVGMVLVASHRARTRARRDGTTELFATCPVTEHQRDVAHLATAWVGVVASVATAAALLVTYRLRAELVWGPFGPRQLALVVGAGTLALGAAAFGVLLARWAPWGIAPVAALAAIGVLVLQLPSWGGQDGSGLAQLSTAPVLEGFDWLDSTFRSTRWVAHEAWIASLVVLVVAVLWWAGTRSRAHAALGVLAVSLVVVTGWAATRPTSDADTDRLVSMITEPERHQTCVDLGVPFCVYRGAESLVDGFRPHLAAVLDALPPDVDVGDLRFRQGADVRIVDLRDAVAARLAGWEPAPGVPRMKVSTESYDAARFWLALAAVGIADETAPGRVVDLAGQSRGVVAIWAATRGVPLERALVEMASLGAPDEHGDFSGEARPWPPTCLAGPTPVRWALSDLDAARRVMRLPHRDVSLVVRRDWTRWIDPATPTDELLRALGVSPVGVDAGRTPVIESC